MAGNTASLRPVPRARAPSPLPSQSLADHAFPCFPNAFDFTSPTFSTARAANCHLCTCVYARVHSPKFTFSCNCKEMYIQLYSCTIRRLFKSAAARSNGSRRIESTSLYFRVSFILFQVALLFLLVQSWLTGGPRAFAPTLPIASATPSTASVSPLAR